MARSCVRWMTELAQIDKRLYIYFPAVAFLQVANKSLLHGLNDELMDILATLCLPFTDARRYPGNSSSVLSLNTAAKLMKSVANKPLSATSLVELSKAYLYRAWRCTDSDSLSIFRLANVYLSVLCYTAGQYQTAIDHCLPVVRSQDHSQCSSHVVQGEILPKIDEDIDNVLGLAVFYQHMLASTMSNQEHHSQQVSVFTTKLFAYYLHIKYLPARKYRRFTQTLSMKEFKRYRKCISDTPYICLSVTCFCFCQ